MMMQSNWEPHTLQVRTEHGAPIWENSLAVPQKIRVITGPSNSTPIYIYISKRNVHRKMYTWGLPWWSSG